MVGRGGGFTLPRLQIPSSAPSTPSRPSSLSTQPNSSQPARVLEHKRSNSTPGTSTIRPITTTSLSASLKSGALIRRTNINVLTHSESAKRKKDESNSGACDSFSPQRWRPSVCMHCFETIAIHTSREVSYTKMDISSPPSPQDGNGKDDTLLASSIPLPATPREVEETLVKLSTSLRFSQEKKALSSSPSTNTSTTPRTSLTPRTPKTSPSVPNFFGRSPIDDDDDPFRDFEELYDTAFELKSTSSYDLATTLESVRSSLRNSRERSREQALNKYKESEDDWDGGVDMDVESFVATPQFSYFNNKIMEIASVKQEAERSQADMLANPNVVVALYEILTAKQQQIQKALDKDKINEQDHSKLIERLNAVKDLLKPNRGATW